MKKSERCIATESYDIKRVGHDIASANGASSESQCNKKSDGSQGARRGSQNMPNELSD